MNVDPQVSNHFKPNVSNYKKLAAVSNYLRALSPGHVRPPRRLENKRNFERKTAQGVLDHLGDWKTKIKVERKAAQGVFDHLGDWKTKENFERKTAQGVFDHLGDWKNNNETLAEKHKTEILHLWFGSGFPTGARAVTRHIFIRKKQGNYSRALTE